MLRYTIDT